MTLPNDRWAKLHTVETVVLVEPIEFPLKARYERINTTLEGLANKERRDGEPEIQDNGLDDGDDGPDGGDDSPPKTIRPRGAACS